VEVANTTQGEPKTRYETPHSPEQHSPSSGQFGFATLIPKDLLSAGSSLAAWNSLNISIAAFVCASAKAG
jgi:hypothetical protein